MTIDPGISPSRSARAASHRVSKSNGLSGRRAKIAAFTLGGFFAGALFSGFAFGLLKLMLREYSDMAVRTYLFAVAWIAAALGTVGFLVMMQAWWQFRRHAVAICPTARTDRLIIDGIYRYTRNPMYLGIVLMLTGVAVWIGTLPFVVVPIAYFTVINTAFCPYEEAKLETAFGDEYRRYQAAVRRWI